MLVIFQDYDGQVLDVIDFETKEDELKANEILYGYRDNYATRNSNYNLTDWIDMCIKQGVKCKRVKFVAEEW